MKKKLILLILVFAATVSGCKASAWNGDSRHSFMDAILFAVESAENLDLSDDNISVSSYEGAVSTSDEKFMGLLRAKIRLAHIFSRLEYPAEDLAIFRGYEAMRLMMAFASSGSVDTRSAPFDLGDYIVFRIVLPLGLEPLIRELPVYYDAVMSRPDWEEKFNIIFESGDAYGPTLSRGAPFHLAGFPKVNPGNEYTRAIDVRFADEDLYYSEYDSSMEAWLYSFWMRRHREGSMGTVKFILDWLNKRLDEVESAVG